MADLVRSQVFASALLVSALLSVSCSSDPPVAGRPSTEPAEQPEDVPTDPEPEVEAPAPEPPLPEAREVRIQTSDGVELVGDLREGASAEAPLVVLVHQLSSQRGEWEPLLRRLGVEPALSTFAYDMRGHGESTTRRRGGALDWQSFALADWPAAASDVGQVVAHLMTEEGLSPTRVILVGASIGASEVIIAAPTLDAVVAVAVLSPGRAYRGLDALTPAQSFGERALLAVAAEGEPESATTARDLARIAPRGDAAVIEGRRHGVGMFEETPASLGRVADFVRAQAVASDAPADDAPADDAPEADRSEGEP